MDRTEIKTRFIQELKDWMDYVGLDQYHDFNDEDVYTALDSGPAEIKSWVNGLSRVDYSAFCLDVYNTLVQEYDSYWSN